MMHISLLASDVVLHDCLLAMVPSSGILVELLILLSSFSPNLFSPNLFFLKKKSTGMLPQMLWSFPTPIASWFREP
jgi:hypothetical protein